MLGVLLLLVAGGALERKADDFHLWRAARREASGDQHGALQLLAATAANHPDRAEVRLAHGRLLDRSGQAAAALAEFRAVVESGAPMDRIPAARGLARILSRGGDPITAREALLQCLRQPDIIETGQSLQPVYLDLGQIDDEIEASDPNVLAEWMRRFPGDDEVFSYYLRALDRGGRSAEVAAALRARLATGSAPVSLYLEAVNVLVRRRELRPAQDVLDDARRRFPNEAEVTAAAGWLGYASGDYRASVAAYEKARRNNLGKVEWAVMHAEALSRLGLPAAALAVLREFARHTTPADVASTAAMARTLAMQADSGTSPAWVRLQVRADVPGDVRAPMLFGSWDARGEPQPAQRLTQQAMRRQPDGSWTAEVRLRSRAPLPYLVTISEGPGEGSGEGLPDPDRTLAVALVRLSRLRSDSGELRLHGRRPASLAALPAALADAMRRRDEARAAPACAQRRLVALWIDAGSWLLVQSLVAQGRLPTLSMLQRRGVTAAMHNRTPQSQDALRLFTTFRQPPEVRAAAPAPGSTDLRELLAAAGKSYLPLIWNNAALPSSEDLVLYDRAGVGAAIGPPDLRALHVSVAQIRNDLGRIFGPAGSPATLHAAAADLARMVLRIRIGRALLARHRPDLALLRVDETDALAHRHWSALSEIHVGTPPLAADSYGLLLERAYELLDAELAALLQVIAPQDDLIIFSDHGMRSQTEHDETCLFIADGPSFRDHVPPTIRLDAAQLLPLLLRAAGVPPPQHAVSTVPPSPIEPRRLHRRYPRTAPGRAW